MSIIDEDLLADALHRAADSFEISHDAKERIVAEAHATDKSQSATRVSKALHAVGRGRTILLAAALIVAVSGISLPLLRGEGALNKNPGQHVAVSDQSRTVSGSGFSVTSPPTLSASQGAANTSSKSLTGSPTPASGAALKVGTSVKIESSGSITLTVHTGGVANALTKLGQVAKGDGGFVVSTRANAGSTGNSTFSSGFVILQVPQRRFDTLVTQVQRVGHATLVNTASSDVTSQYVDLGARLTALEASRRQYLAIMARASTISDILAVQAQLNNLQSQIEQLQGQMNVLNNETTYGSLTVNVTTKNSSSSAHHESGIAKAWHDSIRGFVAGFEWLVRAAGPALFALLCLGALLVLGRYGWRAVRRRRL